MTERKAETSIIILRIAATLTAILAVCAGTYWVAVPLAVAALYDLWLRLAGSEASQ